MGQITQSPSLCSSSTLADTVSLSQKYCSRGSVEAAAASVYMRCKDGPTFASYGTWEAYAGVADGERKRAAREGGATHCCLAQEMKHNQQGEATIIHESTDWCQSARGRPDWASKLSSRGALAKKNKRLLSGSLREACCAVGLLRPSDAI